MTGSQDWETDTLYWPTSTPYPDYDDTDRPGDNLFTECILAMNPDSGKLKWYYQFTPHDVHSYDATEPNVLIDARYRGQDRKLMLHADRNGFFYVLDRTIGQILLAKKFIKRLTWASGIGPDGRPQLLPEQDVTCPEAAANWNASAFSPLTRQYYVRAVEDCSVKLSPGSWKTQHPQVEPSKKYLRVLDTESGMIVWEKPQIGEAEGNHRLRRPNRGYCRTRPADRKNLVALPNQRDQQGLADDLYGRRKAIHLACRRSEYHRLLVTIRKREVARSGIVAAGLPRQFEDICRTRWQHKAAATEFFNIMFRSE